MTDVDGCIACDLSSGRRDLPGGRIHQTLHWRVEHCVGPLGIGTLLVKPSRHVEHVADLTPSEVSEMGPLLTQTCAIVRRLTAAPQVYLCLWSHGPAHIHFVVQPEIVAVIEEFGAWGPALQKEMFDRGDLPDRHLVEQFAATARSAFEADGGT